MSIKILVIGLGFLGVAIANSAKKYGYNIIGTHNSKNNHYVDIRDIKSIEREILEVKPNIIYNCAALTNVDEIESESEQGYAVNAFGAKNISSIASRLKIRLIHISTDSVFDGNNKLYSEKHIPNPINEYGKSKLMGENFVKEISNNFVIVRTNFYGQNTEGRFLFNWIVNNLQNKKKINAFDDVIFNPLEVNNLADMLIELGLSEFQGIIHLSSDEIYSKYQFARKISKVLGFDSNLINRGSVRDAKFIAKRPLNTTLSNLLSKQVLTTKIVTLGDWLDNYKHHFL